MSVKKLLVLSAAAAAVMGATAAMAGGPDHMAMPAEPAFQNSVYLDAHVGYSQSNWTDFNSSVFMGAPAASAFAPTDNGKGGVTGGVDMGYNITRHIAVEGGWFYIPQVKGLVTPVGEEASGVAAGTTAKVDSWFAYMAAKLSVPVMENLDLFGKAGVAYRDLTYSTSVAAPAIITQMMGNGHYWAPVFGTGIQYNWNDWQFGAQYMYLPGNDEFNHAIGAGAGAGVGAPNAAPEINQYTGFVGYKFNV